MPESIRALTTAGVLALALAAPATRGEAFVFNPNYVPSMMQAVVLNPCQPGTPCGDAAAHKYGISPYKVMPPGGIARPAGSSRVLSPAVGGVRRAGAQAWTPAATAYTPSPQVSAAVKAEFVKEVAQSSGPQKAQQVAAALRNTDTVQVWAHNVAADGLRPGDLADALASYWVLNWMIANGGDNNRTQSLAVRNQVRAVISGGRLGRLSNPARQQLAETAMLQFLVQVDSYAAARKAADRAMLAKLSDSAEIRFRNEMKIDLRSLVLTNQGFARKS